MDQSHPAVCISMCITCVLQSLGGIQWIISVNSVKQELFWLMNVFV